MTAYHGELKATGLQLSQRDRGWSYSMSRASHFRASAGVSRYVFTVVDTAPHVGVCSLLPVAVTTSGWCPVRL